MLSGMPKMNQFKPQRSHEISGILFSVRANVVSEVEIDKKCQDPRLPSEREQTKGIQALSCAALTGFDSGMEGEINAGIGINSRKRSVIISVFFCHQIFLH